MEKDDKYLAEDTCTLEDNAILSDMSKDSNLLENSVSISNSSETFQESRGNESEIKSEVKNEFSNTLDISLDTLKNTVEENECLDLMDSENSCKQKTDKLEAEEKAEIENVAFDPLDMFSCALKDTDEDEWLDILGNGSFKKKIIKKGLGPDTYPLRGDIVTADISLYAKDSLIEKNKDIKFIVGDLDVLQGIDLVSHLMEKEEKAKVIIPPKLAYGEKGCFPYVASDTDIECDIEIKEVQHVDINSLSVSEKLKYGNDKRLRGNYFYDRGDFVDSVHCYERAIAYLDSIHDCSGMSTEESQSIVDMRIKVHNNMAAAHLKLSAYSAGLHSVELVLKVQPKNVKALFRKAMILGAQGFTDEAIVCLRFAASLEPDTKIIQVELNKFENKRKKEVQSQKAMYQRMFPQTSPRKSSFSKALKWSLVTGSVLAVAVGMAAYRQYHS
ncbi:peptidylprolyl isomerase [Trichonephila clavata]|uniref:peptidylprolyl isomerase n=1 Tax=Trichonephila clavata TaxID=2740835 RepID=A0A8X6J6H9_TRICU|nr:peptidylprolyl isomerase [Trichonephila clavata]